ncbi:MAG: YihY family inner membrane protein [Syntrophaceae bacterium]|nr:YihY family inner membrane protein [Syntrophaceae bacterium]
MPRFTCRMTRYRDRWLIPAVVLRYTVLSFVRNRDIHTAATLAFYGVFALIPLSVAVLFLLSQVFVSSRQVSAAVEAIIIEIVPQHYEVILREVFTLAERKALGFIGLILLLWPVVPLARAIRAGFLNVFKAERSGGFIRDKLLDFVAVLSLLMMFLVLVAGQILYAAASAEAIAPAGTLRALPEGVMPLLTGTLFLSVFFLVFCPVALEWWNLLLGALAAAVLWSIVRPLFALFLQVNPDYGLAFGSLKAVFVLVVWIYYTFAVILFGAELLANTRRREALLLARLLEERKTGEAAFPPVPSRFIRSFEPGEVVFEEDSRGRDMFYILSGAVRILKKGQLLREMTAGDYFGEMAMLIQAPRTASAVAAAPDTRLVVISESNLEAILRENPRIVVHFLREMSGRLRAINERIDDLPESGRGGEGKGPL